MAALFGFFGARSPDWLDRMSAELSHRGDAVTARHEDAAISVAVRDASAGAKTLLWATETLIVAAAGVLRRSEDDELLSARALHALVALHQEDVLQVVRGRFVLAVWTPRGGWVARDGAGTRALYVARFEGRLCFASEPKALHRLPGFPRQLYRPAVAQYLTFSFVPGHRTMLEDIYEIPGGHWLPVDPEDAPIPLRWFRFEDAEAPDLEAPRPRGRAGFGHRCTRPPPSCWTRAPRWLFCRVDWTPASSWRSSRPCSVRRCAPMRCTSGRRTATSWSTPEWWPSALGRTTKRS